MCAAPSLEQHSIRIARARRLRAAIGLFACIVLPGVSWLEGSTTFAWTMYSRSGQFRIDLVTFDSAGLPHARNPTLLAAHAAPGAASLLAGSEHWRQGPPMIALRRHLDELAQYACSETGATAVEVVLWERLVGNAEHSTTRSRRCER